MNFHYGCTPYNIQYAYHTHLYRIHQWQFETCVFMAARGAVCMHVALRMRNRQCVESVRENRSEQGTNEDCAKNVYTTQALRLCFEIVSNVMLVKFHIKNRI